MSGPRLASIEKAQAAYLKIASDVVEAPVAREDALALFDGWAWIWAEMMAARAYWDARKAYFDALPRWGAVTPDELEEWHQRNKRRLIDLLTARDRATEEYEKVRGANE